jgi:hypothetical protein
MERSVAQGLGAGVPREADSLFPGGRGSCRVAPNHLKPGAFIEGDLPQRALLGRADRDVVEAAAVGMAGRAYQGHRDGRGVHHGSAVALRIAGHCAERAMNAR